MLITICRALPERIKETLPLWSERVVARWRRSVASGEALVMLHRVMRSVLHRPTAMAIERPVTELHFFAAAAYFDCCSRS